MEGGDSMNKGLWGALVIALLVVGGAVALAAGSIPSEDGVFTACYDGGGNVKLLPTGTTKCPRNWFGPVYWNQEGPPGPTGPPGPSFLSVVLRESSRQLTLAPGEGDYLSSGCLAGEVVLGGGPTASSPQVTIAGTGPFFDGTHSGWSVRFENHGAETVTFTPSVGAECVPGSMSGQGPSPSGTPPPTEPPTEPPEPPPPPP